MIFNRAIHQWFGLSYSSYFVVPRLALQEMPEGWQDRFVALMEEAEEIGMETPQYTVLRRNGRGKFTKDPWSNYRHGSVAQAKEEDRQALAKQEETPHE